MFRTYIRNALAFLLVPIRVELELWCTLFKSLSSLRRILWSSRKHCHDFYTWWYQIWTTKMFPIMTCVMFDSLKSLTIDMMIDLIALFETSCLKEMKFSGNWDACQNWKLWVKSKILLKACLLIVDAHPWDANNSAGLRTTCGINPGFGYWVDDVSS